MNASSLAPVRRIILLSLLFLTACATTVAISGRFPARFPETASIRKLVVGRFDGPGGADFASALEGQLASATFDGQRYFNVVPGDANGRVDAGRAAAVGRAVGAQGVVFGGVVADFNTEQFQGSESRCVRAENGKCRQYQSFPIACWRRAVQITATPRMVRAASGEIIYSAQKSAGRQTRWCQNSARVASDQAMATAARDQIIEEIRRDIGPYNAVLNATLKTTGDGLSGDPKAEFAAAVKFASGGDMAEACKRWEAVNVAQPNNLPTVYDLGVCAESSGAYAKAMTLYRQAQGLSAKPDSAISASLTRTQNLIQASGQLAEEQDRRDAAVAAERQREAAEARAQAAASARAASARQEAAASAKAAEAERQRTARARYGDAAPAVLAGKIVPGMSKDLVIAARGKPSTIRRLSPTEEMWSYGAQRVVFLNGRVTTVR